MDRSLTLLPASLSCRAAFQYVDTDNGGTIDPDEFTVLCNELDPSMTTADIDEAIAKIDLDGDGEIDFDEFKFWWNGGDQDDSDNDDDDDDDDDDDAPSSNPLQQRLLALIMLKNSKATVVSTTASSSRPMPDLNDPAVRSAGRLLIKAFNRRKLRIDAAKYVADAACLVYTCRRLIDLSILLIAGTARSSS